MTTVGETQCDHCKHFRPSLLGTGSCSAFPNGIAFDVWSGQTSHLEPLTNDRGIQFEPLEQAQRPLEAAVRTDAVIAEDIHQDSPLARRVRNALAHWSEQHDYDGPSWDGIQSFHAALAGEVDEVAVESAGWYRYPSSKRPDMDGKDWRLVI